MCFLYACLHLLTSIFFFEIFTYKFVYHCMLLICDWFVSNVCLQLKNCEKNCATYGGGRNNGGGIGILLPAAESVILEYNDDPHHPSLPEPDFVLRTLPVRYPYSQPSLGLIWFKWLDSKWIEKHTNRIEMWV
jgi:hypothetical protein